jgi:hydrogenase maturation protein HypF
MARDLEAVRRVCEVSPQEEAILEGDRKPILLLQKREPEILPEDIAPGQRRLGVMLPYAPLQVLLFPNGLDFLVMTSGNSSGTSICYRDDAVVESLGGIAAYILTHNREIMVPVDDAVVKIADQHEILIRCGRGYAPLTIPIKAGPPLLAVGAEQKSSICMGRDGFAAVSQYIGALDGYQTYGVFEGQIQHFRSLFQYKPSIIAHDWNPDDLPARYAAAQTGPTVAVQHHHAHMAGCMAEHGLSGPAIGVIYDGTGLGTDGAVWGGEFLTGTLSGFTRAGHLAYVRLQGGDLVAREPWRCAASYLCALQVDPGAYLPHAALETLDAVCAATRQQVQCFSSSSMGRLFDCVAALCGFQGSITYEAQAAIELEGLADPEVRECYHYRIDDTGEGVILDYEELLRAILDDLRQQVPVGVISARFHQSIVEATAACVCRIHETTGLQDVVLSGGVFENGYLLEGLISKLRDQGLCVYYNRLTPTNDGGIAFGQAAVAGAMGKEKGYVSCYSSQSR